MKEILSYHQPITGKLQQLVYLLTDKECDKFEKSCGSPIDIIREYEHCKPAPFRIEGLGWIDRYDSVEILYIRKSTYVTEEI